MMSSYSARVWSRVSVVPLPLPVVGVGVVGGVDGGAVVPPLRVRAWAWAWTWAWVWAWAWGYRQEGLLMVVSVLVLPGPGLAGLAALVLRRRSARQLPGKGPICR